MNDTGYATTDRPELVVIYRGLEPVDVLGATGAFVDVGVTAFEVTLNSPRPFETIAAVAERFAAVPEWGPAPCGGRTTSRP